MTLSVAFADTIFYLMLSGNAYSTHGHDLMIHEDCSAGAITATALRH